MINYFLFHTRYNTKVGEKLNASLSCLQIECGTFQHFLSSSFLQYRHYATNTLLKCLWEETEPQGMVLRPEESSVWIPTPQGNQEIPLMEIVSRHYGSKEAIMINCYRLYLQVISLYDLLLYNGTEIHPDFLIGRHATGRKSAIYWVSFPKPPKKYLLVWKQFLETHIKPITPYPVQWTKEITPNYRNDFLYSSMTQQVYRP